MKRRDAVTIIVRPSTREKAYPLTAFIAGEVQVEGCGPTVFSAIEDLFTCAKAAKACQQLEQFVARVEKPA